MANLITRADIQAHRQVSDSVYDKVINQYIEDAQFLDLQDLLGMDFYNAIIADEVTHADLLDGSSYTYDGKTYTHVGLKRVLIYYAYARYIRFGSSTDTPFGLVQKNTPESTEVSDKEKQIIYKMNQQTAFKYWTNVKLFLERTNYEGWSDSCSKSQTFRIRKIS